MKYSLDGTRERFVAAIGAAVNADAIEEAHFFVPIKQSGMESGVAVIALREEQQSTAAEGAAENRPDALGASAENTRHAVYAARYRLTLKGPDRGKWDFSIIAEADAPLVTVDKVVRGVERRSGDAEPPERLSGDEFRALLPPAEPARDQSS
jgi:hypothetical protein